MVVAGASAVLGGGALTARAPCPHRLGKGPRQAVANGPARGAGRGGRWQVARAQQEPERYPVERPKTKRTFKPPFGRKNRKGGDGSTVASRALTTVLQTTTIPMGDYIPFPKTVIHMIDPRVKQAWLLALVVLPALSPVPVRVGMAGFVGFMTIVALPRRVWKPQLSRLLFLGAFVYVFTAIGSDGVPLVVQPRAPGPEVDGLPSLPELEGAYKYVLLQAGPLTVTQRGASLAASLAALSFTILQSANLVLTTTAPEELAASIAWYLRPLKPLGVPVDEVTLTLLLSLRFMSIVFEEIRNLALGVAARGVQTRGGTNLAGGMEMVFALFTRLFSKLFAHADKISEAMTVRGFRSAEAHTVYNLKPLRLGFGDVVAMAMLMALVAFVVTAEVY